MMKAALSRFCRDQSGQTAIEYGLIVLVLGLAIVVSLISMGESIRGMFEGVSDGFTP